jgi:chaperone required for assembly of F1-ATPase
MSMSKAKAENRELPKRFYKDVSARPDEGGWSVLLDGRPVKTPAKRALKVPSETLAQALAAEWAAQETVIDPFTMPITRILHVALDRIAQVREGAAEEVANFGRTDLLSHRADDAGLAARQAELWDPYLEWAKTALDAPLNAAATVLALEQPDSSIEALKARALAQDDLRLTALVSVTPILGSAILAFALLEGEADADAVWQAARVDDDYQIERWGEDSEAALAAANRKRDLIACETVMRALDDAGL